MSKAIIDAGPLVAYYNAGDPWNAPIRKFLETFRGQLITTSAIVTETVWLLRRSPRVQNEFLLDLSKGLYHVEPLEQNDFARIADLNIKYADLPGDFGDLTLIAISERLNIKDVVSLDSDFNLYRRYRKGLFNQIFPS